MAAAKALPGIPRNYPAAAWTQQSKQMLPQAWWFSPAL